MANRASTSKLAGFPANLITISSCWGRLLQHNKLRKKDDYHIRDHSFSRTLTNLAGSWNCHRVFESPQALWDKLTTTAKKSRHLSTSATPACIPPQSPLLSSMVLGTQGWLSFLVQPCRMQIRILSCSVMYLHCKCLQFHHVNPFQTANRCLLCLAIVLHALRVLTLDS